MIELVSSTIFKFAAALKKNLREVIISGFGACIFYLFVLLQDCKNEHRTELVQKVEALNDKITDSYVAHYALQEQYNYMGNKLMQLQTENDALKKSLKSRKR